MQGFKDWIIENSYFDDQEIDEFKFKNNYDLAEKYAEKQLELYMCSVKLRKDKMERQELVELISKKVTPLVIGDVENKIIMECLYLINKKND